MKELLKNQKTLILSTIDELGEPFASYSTYVSDNTDIYIYISKTAPHYDYVLNNKKISGLIIEDESASASLFARNRAYFKCVPEIIESDCESILDKFAEIHGKNIMTMLTNLDFSIFKLNIESGKLVRGFGKAYNVTIENNDFKTEQLTSDDIKAHKANKMNK